VSYSGTHWCSNPGLSHQRHVSYPPLLLSKILYGEAKRERIELDECKMEKCNANCLDKSVLI